MSDNDKTEIGYYPEICLKMAVYLKDIFGADHQIAYSQNKSLSEMVNEIHSSLGLDRGDTYYPSLRTDIAFGIRFPSGKLALMLLEVKRGKSLGLMNFSQLIGYMQVAKHIRIGILLLVNEGVKASPLSIDFSSIIDVGQLPADWKVLLTHSDESYDFQAGICLYTPNNGIEWVDSDNCYGISSWDQLKESLSAE